MSALAGPVGGVVAGAFGTGAAAGYAFAIRTVLKSARERMIEMRDDARRAHDDCERQLAEVKAELAEYRDILMGKSPLPRFIGARTPKRTPRDMKRAIDKLDEGG